MKFAPGAPVAAAEWAKEDTGSSFPRDAENTNGSCVWGGCVVLRTTQAPHTRYGFYGFVSDVVVVAMIGGVVSELTKVTDVVVRMTTVDVLETPPRGALVFDEVTDVVGCVVIGVVVAVGGFELGPTAGSSEVGPERSVRPSPGPPGGVRTTAVDAEGTGGGTVDIVHERGVLATTGRTTFVDEGATTGDRNANAAGRLFTGTGDCATA